MSSGAQYWQQARALFGSSIVDYWPLWEASGTVATDIVNARNGAYVNGSLGNTGIGDGRTSFSEDGTSDAVNLYSAAFAAAFPYEEGGLAFFAKVADANVWEDGASRYLVYLQADASNRIMIRRETTNNQISFFYIAGGTTKSKTINVTTDAQAVFSKTDWFRVLLTWSLSAGTFDIYINGALASALTGVGDWTGTLGATTAVLGAIASNGANAWNGSLAHTVLVNRKITADEARRDSRFTPSSTRSRIISILGDSISNDATEWPYTVRVSYNSGNAMICDHAATGHNIITNMDTQTVAAANDNADAIIIALGTNDDNAGNMATLQAEYEENIAELKVSNPNATIYALNVLPRWTNNTIGPEVDKSNIRAAIAAACTAQGITCWDTYTDPWITQAQTSDGQHPTAAGHAAIAAEVLALL